LGIGVCVSIQFGVIEYMKRFYAERNLLNGVGGPGGRNLNGGQLFVSGVLAGLANGFVSGPVEHIRIRTSSSYNFLALFFDTYHPTGLQTQQVKNYPYAGPFDAIKKIYSAHGISGIFKGQGVTFLREATGYGVYFLAYEKLVQREMATKGISRDQINPMNAVLYGAAAGYAVSRLNSYICSLFSYFVHIAVGGNISYRHGQVADADRWIHNRHRS
jgi:solute carrier family 25 (mitochondrial carnitine/acylcarnitine transporter), member 20/29